MTPTQRQALEAAKAFLLGGNFVYPTKLLTDIKAALAEPEQEPAKRLQWHLDSETSKFLADMITADNEPTEITLCVGKIQEDDGTVKHGLLVFESEEYEEGASLLVECEPIYTSPQPREWQELSEVEFAQLRQKCVSLEDLCSWSFHQGAMLADGALRAKNGANP